MLERRPDEVAVLAWARTPFGRFGGALRGVRLPALGAVAVRAAVERSGLPAESVDEVAMGVNFPGSERSVARQVALMVAEAITSEVGLDEVVGLDARPHRPVDHEDPLAQGCFQRCSR